MKNSAEILKDLKLFKQGKVRDIYDLGEHFLMVATDRISAFDVVMDKTIPRKGVALNQISIKWFDVMDDLVENHLWETDPEHFPEECWPYQKILAGRSMLVQKAEPFPVECIVRGYLSGSGWKSYQKNGTVCDIKLPDGLIESDRLPEPIFTPSTKAENGHDENISFEKMAAIVGKDVAEKLRWLSLKIYSRGAQLALERGIIIADTKLEFGLIDGDIALIDEVLTPDSSRFWPKDKYQPGRSQESYDKQYLRDWLEASGWNKEPPPPTLPVEVIQKTAQKYWEAARILGAV